MRLVQDRPGPDFTLGRLNPERVIVQAGHDDEDVPAAVEASRVRTVISQIRAADPHARIALLTTFSTTADGTPALRATDQWIARRVAAILAANGIGAARTDGQSRRSATRPSGRPPSGPLNDGAPPPDGQQSASAT